MFAAESLTARDVRFREECEIQVGPGEEDLQNIGGSRFLEEFPNEEPYSVETLLTIGGGTGEAQKTLTGEDTIGA